LVSPSSLLHAGFWLSFIAVCLLFLSERPSPLSMGSKSTLPPVGDYPAPLHENDGNHSTQAEQLVSKARSSLAQVVETVGDLLREQWVIFLGLSPWVLLFFHQISLLGLGVNLVAIPWVTLVLTPLSMLGTLWPPLWELAFWNAQALLAFLQWATHLSELLPKYLNSFNMAAVPLWISALGIAGAAALIVPWPWYCRLLGLPWVAALFLWPSSAHERPAQGHFELLGLDIGQGNALLVRTARHSLLYDTGPRFSQYSNAGDRIVVPLLQAMGERLNMVVVSHQDSDHSGGALAVAQTQPQAQLLTSAPAVFATLTRSTERGEAFPAPSSILPEPLSYLNPAPKATKQTITLCQRGQRWLWDGVQFEIIHPQALDYGKTQKTNPLSCVLRISNGKQTALLTGDIESAQETTLVEKGLKGPIDLLLVPHHGSKTSSSNLFLDSLQPKMAWVQASYRNHYKHPNPAVVQAYKTRQVHLVDSVHCGAMHWQSTHPKQVVCEREKNKHYWHFPLPPDF
jgi:competence protein ComEC